MAGVWGLDVEQVRELGNNLDREAESIDAILSKLTNVLSSTQWTGPDADQFRNDWQSVHSSALRRVAGALRDTAQAAKANANAQEQVSRG